MSHIKIAVGAVLIAAGLLSLAAWQHAQMPPLPDEVAVDMAEVRIRDADIALFEARATADPFSAADRARLASLYFQRSRETGDFEDYRRAERTARASVGLRTERNSGALLILSSSLLAQHRFAEARVVAEQLVALEPDKPSARSLLGEIQLELGDYQAANRTFQSLRMDRFSLAVLPRYARWAEMTGRAGEARELLDRALIEARGRGDLPREQIAWFYLRSADFDMRHGNLRAAERALRAGLTIEPADHRLWGALAQLAALRGDADAVIEYAQRAGDRADFTTLSARADAHRERGETELARNLHAQIEMKAAADPEPFARQWTQYRLDNDVALEETVALLAEEAAQRPDALGWDMYAWGLYKLGRAQEAREAMQKALHPGIQDARYYFHAAAIERAVGNHSEADKLFARARNINSRMVHRLMQREAKRVANLKEERPVAIPEEM